MFEKQKKLIDVLPEVQYLFTKHKCSNEVIVDIENMARNFSVRVPLVGAFSCGKSSLLNALIGESFFATSIDPQTALPAELSYANEERLIGYTQEGNKIGLTRTQIKENQLNSLHPNGWLDIQLPNAKLAALPHIRLVDMPGWDSGNDGHTQAIDSYASRSLAYCVVVSADEGSLHESIRIALQELNLHEMPVIAIITKCDKKPEKDVDDIAIQVAIEIEKILGKPPLKLVKVSSRKKNVASFLDALGSLEELAEPLFSQNVIKPFVVELRQLSKYLDTLINRDDLDSEKIKIAYEQNAEQRKIFDSRLSEETQRLDERVSKIAENIQRQLKDNLIAQLDSFATIALRNGDLNTPIGQTIRLAITKGCKEELEPEMRHYFSKVSEIVPKNMNIELRLPEGRHVETDGAGEVIHGAVKEGVFLVISNLLLKSKNKYAVALVVVLKPLIELVSSFFKNASEKEVAQLQRREEARQYILNHVIPQAIQSNDESLLPALLEHVKHAKASIAANIQKQVDSLDAALVELKETLAKGQDAFAITRAGYLDEQEKLQKIIREFAQ